MRSGVMSGLVLIRGKGSNFPVSSTTKTYRIGMGVVHGTELFTYKSKCLPGTCGYGQAQNEGVFVCDLIAINK